MIMNYGRNSPNVNSAGLLGGAVLAQLLGQLALGLLGIWGLGDRFTLFVTLTIRLVLVATALEALDQSLSLVVITLVLSLTLISRGDILLGIFLFGLNDGLGLLGLGARPRPPPSWTF